MYHKMQTSTGLDGWQDAGVFVQAFDTKGSWTDPDPLPGRKFYRVLRSTTP
jgi:hypothetical protein